HARGEWIAFLDDDDVCAPEKLARQLARARATGAPLVLCGMRYHTCGGRRRVRQGAAPEFRGAELLLKAQAASQAIFHRRAHGVRFTACVPAEDADYYHQLVRHFGIDVVPNVPAPLVEIFQQPAPARLNADPDRVWRAHRAVWARHASRYGRPALRLAGARALFLRAWLGGGSPRLQAKAARWLWRLGGSAELRFMLNVVLRRVPGLRRLLSV
ncbi:MAG TPA: glycosyltransferase, partial [Opitutaceae bacterium]